MQFLQSFVRFYPQILLKVIDDFFGGVTTHDFVFAKLDFHHGHHATLCPAGWFPKLQKKGGLEFIPYYYYGFSFRHYGKDCL